MGQYTSLSAIAILGDKLALFKIYVLLIDLPFWKLLIFKYFTHYLIEVMTLLLLCL